VEQRADYFSRWWPEPMYEAACANARGPIGFCAASYD
jgi:hypothetical protein